MTNTFLYLISPEFLSGVKVTKQPCAEVIYEVDKYLNVEVTHILFDPTTLKYLIHLEWLVNQIYEAAINNAQNTKPLYMEEWP